MEAANLAEAIADLDRQERALTLELMDVLTDIDQRAEYRLKAKLKVRFAKKLVKSTRLEPLMSGPNFNEALNRVESTYPDDGGREGINLLVAVHNLVLDY